MKNNTTLKLLLTSGTMLGLATSASTSLLTNKSHPVNNINVKQKPQLNNNQSLGKVDPTSWKGFVQTAKRVTPLELVMVTNPTGWTTNDLAKIKLSQVLVNVVTKTVQVYATKNDNGNWTKAVFENTYHGKVFTFVEWKCTNQPKTCAPIDFSAWEKFRRGAKTVLMYELMNDTDTAHNNGTTWPQQWMSIPSNQLKMGLPWVDEYNNKVLVNITRIDGNKIEKAIFVAQYYLGCPAYRKEYSVSWSLHSFKTLGTQTWDDFKKVALNVSARDLLGQSNALSFDWHNGAPQNRFWHAGELAEFDTFGGLGPNDTYKGMGGRPVVDEHNKTITAIISRFGKDGAYDSDPIKAVMTYDDKKETPYVIYNWKFSKDTQLQSYNKFKSLYERQIKRARNSVLADFMNHNWGYCKKSVVPTKVDHDAWEHKISGRIFNEIESHAGNSVNNWTYPNLGTIFNFKGGKRAWIAFRYRFGYTYPMFAPFTWQLDLTMNYWYVNGHDDSDGGTAFNYMWLMNTYVEGI